jgi:hypothetical protein
MSGNSDITIAEHYCEARTWAQDRAGSWGNANVGCLRAATTQVTDDRGSEHWACSQHAKKPPACGWNR